MFKALIVRTKILAVVLLVAVVLGWWAWRGSAPPPDGPQLGAGPSAVAVAARGVRVAPIAEILTLTASVQPAERISVATQVGGRVERVAVRLGDSVEQGQVVAWLDDEERATQVEQARAELAVANAQVEEADSSLELAETEFKRVQALRQQQVASEAELQQAQAELAAARARRALALAQVKQRQAALSAAELTLSHTQVRAQWEGEDTTRWVSSRLVDAGAILTANSPVIELIDMDPLIAVASVSERDYVRLRNKQAATVSSPVFPRTTFQARLVRLAPELDEASRQARIEFEVDNPSQQLTPGMFVTLRVVLDQVSEAIQIPQSAVVRREGQVGVFRLDDAGTSVEFVALDTGIETRDWVEVRSPALTGRVVTLGQHLLRDGSTVRVTETTEAAAE